MSKKIEQNNVEIKNLITFDRVVRIVFGALIVTGIYLLINQLSGVLLPFLIGWLLAYILNPVVEFFQFTLKFKNRIISVIITLLVVCGIITGLIFLLQPMMAAELEKVSALIKNYTQNVNVSTILPPAVQKWLKETFQSIDVEQLLSDDSVKATIQKIAPQLWGLFTGSISMLIGFLASFIAIVYMIFIMVDYHHITNAIFNIFPKKYSKISIEILTDVGVTMNRYFRGQLLIGACVAVIMSVGFLIIGLPLGIVMGIFVGICNIVPYMQVLSIPPVAVMGLLHCAETGQTVWSMAIAILVVYLVSQAIQDFFLTPKIMGKVTGLRPAYILLALSVWGALLGIIGMIIALPLTQLCISYYKRFVLRQEVVKSWESKKYEEKYVKQEVVIEEKQMYTPTEKL
ncbi:AI-2E family transporter [Bacteroidia bacterium]|nr:AI-2E family transporter [Bacteroidia bacterium]GHV44350.1 AI-2E family transporter [Bacteroidia bacterium]